MPKTKKLKVFYLILLLLVLLVGILIGFVLFNKEIKEEKNNMNIEIPELSLKDFVQVQVALDGQSVLLRANCFEISAITTTDQALSIQNALENKSFARPLTHDLISNILETFNIEILQVKITDMRENTYYSKIFLRQRNKILAVDSRPSDAIAIALRMDKPVYINKSLIEKYGRKIC